MGPRPRRGPQPHASQRQKLLFLGHNSYLNDVKDRAAFGVTNRNAAIQGYVNTRAGACWAVTTPTRASAPPAACSSVRLSPKIR